MWYGTYAKSYDRRGCGAQFVELQQQIPTEVWHRIAIKLTKRQTIRWSLIGAFRTLLVYYQFAGVISERASTCDARPSIKSPRYDTPSAPAEENTPHPFPCNVQPKQFRTLSGQYPAMQTHGTRLDAKTLYGGYLYSIKHVPTKTHDDTCGVRISTNARQQEYASHS